MRNHKQQEQKKKQNNCNEKKTTPSKHPDKNKSNLDKRSTLSKTPSEKVEQFSLKQENYPTLGESLPNQTIASQQINISKQKISWKDQIAKREEEENEKQLDTIQPGWIRLRMDKQTHKIIKEYGPPLKDSGWFERWQDYEHMLKYRQWLAYMEEQEEIRRELEPDYLYQREDFSDQEYDTDDEDIIVEEDCLSDEADYDY